MDIGTYYAHALRLLSPNEMKRLKADEVSRYIDPFGNLQVKKDKKTRLTLKQYVAMEEARYMDMETKFKDILDKTGGKVVLAR